MAARGCNVDTPLSKMVMPLDCGSLSRSQEQIIWLLREAGFGALHVSRPAFRYRMFPFDPEELPSHEFHAPGETDVDFFVPNIGPHPELMRAFVALSQVWPGGLGISIQPGNQHLHVDNRGTNSRRWIEVGTPGTEIVNSDRLWGGYFAAAQKMYQYYGSGGVDWKAFYQARGMTYQEFVQTITAAATSINSFVKWTAIGLAAYFGLKALGFIERVEKRAFKA